MPDGRFHGTVTLGASVAITVIGFRYGYPLNDVLTVAGGCLAGLVLSPDMDVDNGFLGNHVVNKLFGIILGWAWKALWVPYAFLIPHRSGWSHFPGVSTLVRLLYCLLIEWAASRIFNFRMYIPGWDIFILIFFGLSVSDALHWLADMTGTATRSRIWTIVSDVRNANRNSRSRTGSMNRIPNFTRAVAENWFISLLRRT